MELSFIKFVKMIEQIEPLMNEEQCQITLELILSYKKLLGEVNAYK